FDQLADRMADRAVAAAHHHRLRPGRRRLVDRLQECIALGEDHLGRMAPLAESALDDAADFGRVAILDRAGMFIENDDGIGHDLSPAATAPRWRSSLGNAR